MKQAPLGIYLHIPFAYANVFIVISFQPPQMNRRKQNMWKPCLRKYGPRLRFTVIMW